MVTACFMRSLSEALSLTDGSVGAGAFASTAIDALVSIDLVGGITGGDGAYRAYVCAGTA